MPKTLFSWSAGTFSGPAERGFAGSWLRKGRGHRGMEGNFAFHFLHHLMDMPVEHSHGAEAFYIRQRLRAIVGTPAPIGIDRPQWNVREEHDGCAGRASLQVFLEPLKLLVTERSQAARLQVGNIHKADEMHPLVIEAVPAGSI